MILYTCLCLVWIESKIIEYLLLLTTTKNQPKNMRDIFTLNSFVTIFKNMFGFYISLYFIHLDPSKCINPNPSTIHQVIGITRQLKKKVMKISVTVLPPPPTLFFRWKKCVTGKYVAKISPYQFQSFGFRNSNTFFQSWFNFNNLNSFQITWKLMLLIYCNLVVCFLTITSRKWQQVLQNDNFNTLNPDRKHGEIKSF